MFLFARSVFVVGLLLFFISVSGLDPDANAGDPPATIFENGFEIFSCSQTEPIELVYLGGPPDLLIVLDRSGSMTSPIPTFPPNFTPKWTIMRDALNGLAGSYEDTVRFGLLEFPTNDDCAVAAGTAVRVPVDLGQAPEIASYFQSRNPNGNTPAQLGLAVALSHYQSIPVNPAGRYVLFATDGEPNCSVGDPAAETVAAVSALAQAGVSTYVLGFGGGFVEGTVLNDAAIAGEVPRQGGPPHYYAANNAQELAAVLDSIAGGIMVQSCSYALASAPPDPDAVTVTLNGVAVPRSNAHTSGWDYHPDAMTITFFGSYCEQIESDKVNEVSFVPGCPGPGVD